MPPAALLQCLRWQIKSSLAFNLIEVVWHCSHWCKQHNKLRDVTRYQKRKSVVQTTVIQHKKNMKYYCLLFYILSSNDLEKDF